MHGEITVAGDSISLYGVDIDDVIAKYNRSQKFNLVDAGAFVLAGPMGAVVTKSTDFAMLLNIDQDSTVRTAIQTFRAKLGMGNGLLTTEDVAFTTRMNRIAFSGTIDFENSNIPGFTVAVVDKNGCSLMDQKLYGKMNALQRGKLNVTKTLFGSVINSVKAIAGTDCKPFYTGSVHHPGQ
jgi:AsmA protein